MKELYSSPTTDILVVRFEENFCGTNFGSQGSAGKGFSSTNGNIHDLTNEADF